MQRFAAMRSVVAPLVLLSLLGICSAALAQWSTSCASDGNCTRLMTVEISDNLFIDEWIQDIWDEKTETWLEPYCVSTFLCVSDERRCADISTPSIGACDTGLNIVQEAYVHVLSGRSYEMFTDALLPQSVELAVKIVPEREHMHRLILSLGEVTHVAKRAAPLLRGEPHFSLGIRIYY